MAIPVCFWEWNGEGFLWQWKAEVNRERSWTQLFTRQCLLPLKAGPAVSQALFLSGLALDAWQLTDWNCLVSELFCSCLQGHFLAYTIKREKRAEWPFGEPHLCGVTLWRTPSLKRILLPTQLFFIQFLFTFNWHINTIWIGGVPCGTSALAYNAQRSDPEGAITVSISANS